MAIFAEWIQPGMKVLEIGGHIGYLATYFAYLTGKTGKVVVFEPDGTNRSFLYKNIDLSNYQNYVVVPKGAGNENKTMQFYVDPITGQNNSLVKDFKGFYANRNRSGSRDAALDVIEIDVVRLDDFCTETNFTPDIVKIDVEGFEFEVVEGFRETIQNYRPKLMIEIQRNEEPIIQYFLSEGYRVMNEKKQPIQNMEDYHRFKTPNIFFIP